MTLTNKIKLEDLRDSIHHFKSGKKPIIIAIDGPSGSGKSYFAKRLSNVLTNSFIVEMDYFISWNSLDAGVERAIHQLFEPLLNPGKVRYHARDWAGDFFGDGLGEWKDVPVRDYIIAEGIGSGRIEYSKYLNVLVWVEAPEDLCIKRGLERDSAVLLNHWETFKIKEKNFFKNDQTKTRSDYIVDGITGEIFKT